MTDAKSVSDHWGSGDVYSCIVEAMQAAGIDPETVTIEQLAPVDHFHACGISATVALADALPIKAGQHLVDIGCGLGGPARFLAKRFGCKVDVLDIAAPFVDAANRLIALVGMKESVTIQQGDGQKLPYADKTFDGGYTQHVTMNVPDRDAFFREAYRVLKPGAFFALTEHGLGGLAIRIIRCPGRWTVAEPIRCGRRILSLFLKDPVFLTSRSLTLARSICMGISGPSSWQRRAKRRFLAFTSCSASWRLRF